MKGLIEKVDGNWVVKSGDKTYPLHEIDVDQIKADSLVFDDIEGRIACYPNVNFYLVEASDRVFAKLMGTDLSIYSDSELIAMFMAAIKTNMLNTDVWDIENSNGYSFVLFYDSSWDWLMPVIRKINTLGKEVQFAIFKTYVSCTVEKGGKFYKDFSFSHAEYITSEQTDIQAAFKLVVKFVRWYYQTNAS